MDARPPKLPLEERVVRAAEAALNEEQRVSAIDVLMRIGYLHPAHIEYWRRGTVSCLEEAFPVSAQRVSQALQTFQQWLESRALVPIEGVFFPRSRHTDQQLRFSRSGDPVIEQFFRTHFVSPQVPERKREKLQQKLTKAPDLVVYSVVRDSKCSECGVELPGRSLLFMEGNQPLCMECAGLDHLVYLASGDAALTRRARKYSALSAVVVRFSRARKRYERQGLLVEEQALERAEQECMSDADARERKRDREAERRASGDIEFAGQMTEKILELFPRCPREEALLIARHASVRGSGRVGRSAAGRRLDPEAIALAVRASVRHRHTRYDEILMRTGSRTGARAEVSDKIEAVLDGWREQA